MAFTIRNHFHENNLFHKKEWLALKGTASNTSLLRNEITTADFQEKLEKWLCRRNSVSKVTIWNWNNDLEAFWKIALEKLNFGKFTEADATIKRRSEKNSYKPLTCKNVSSKLLSGAAVCQCLTTSCMLYHIMHVVPHHACCTTLCMFNHIMHVVPHYACCATLCMLYRIMHVVQHYAWKD